jgi:MFS transporter, FHS family, glucose/mannose:H+ symporter
MNTLFPAAQQPSRTTMDRAAAVRSLGPVYCYFLIAGLCTVMLGPLLPILIAHWQIPDAKAGTLFAAFFTGNFVGAWFATHNLRSSLVYGAALSGVACLSLARLNFNAAHIALFCMGLGLGAGLTAGNVIVGTVIPAARTRLLTLLNVAWGIGAISCSLLLRLSLPVGISRFFFATAVCLVCSALISTAIPHSANPPSHPEAHSRKDNPVPTFSLLAFASAIALYVGIENALGGWLPSYAIRSNPSLHATSIAIYFWTAELIGRLVVSALLTFLPEALLFRISVSMLILVEILLSVISNPSATQVVGLVVLAALALSPLFPLIVSFMLARTGNQTRLGPLFATASLGGACLPWLTGVISTHFHGLHAGLFVPAIAAVCLLLLSTALITKKTLSSTTPAHRI